MIIYLLWRYWKTCSFFCGTQNEDAQCVSVFLSLQWSQWDKVVCLPTFFKIFCVLQKKISFGFLGELSIINLFIGKDMLFIFQFEVIGTKPHNCLPFLSLLPSTPVNLPVDHLLKLLWCQLYLNNPSHVFVGIFRWPMWMCHKSEQVHEYEVCLRHVSTTVFGTSKLCLVDTRASSVLTQVFEM